MGHASLGRDRAYWFELFDPEAEEGRVGSYGGCDIEVIVVGCPPKRGSQVGQLDGEPVIRLTLSELSHKARMSASRPAK